MLPLHLPRKSCARGASGVSEAILGGGARRGSSETVVGSAGRNHTCTSAAYPSSEKCFPDLSGEELRVSVFRKVKRRLSV